MKSYKIYFEIFGKKMATTIDSAVSKDHAIELLASKIKIHEVREVEAPVDPITDLFSMFGEIFLKSPKKS